MSVPVCDNGASDAEPSLDTESGSVSDEGSAAPKKAADKATSGKSSEGGPKRVDAGTENDVGQLLRGAYRQTVEEAIPDDLMDLLNRLE